MEEKFFSNPQAKKHKEGEYKEGVLKAEQDCARLVFVLIKNDLSKKMVRHDFIDELLEYLVNHDRLLYSTISKVIFEIETDKNLDNLLQNCKILINGTTLSEYVSSSDKSKLGPYTKTLEVMFFKIYDHVNLAAKQAINTARIQLEAKAAIDNHISSTKKEIESQAERVSEEFTAMQSELKDAQKDYITILGIFASIVLAFTSGLVFNSSILENMHNNDLSDMICVAIVLMQGLIHLTLVLLQNIYNIYNGNKPDREWKYPVWLIWVNVVSALILMLNTSLPQIISDWFLNVNPTS